MGADVLTFPGSGISGSGTRKKSKGIVTLSYKGQLFLTKPGTQEDMKLHVGVQHLHEAWKKETDKHEV